MKKTTYYAGAEGHILGKLRKVGDSVGELTDNEAKYLEMNGTISKTNPKEAAKLRKEEPDPATLDRKTR